MWASHVGEVWFYPKEGFHLSNVRGGVTDHGSEFLVTIAAVVGDSQYLDEAGNMPDIQIRGQKT